jgi:hypothetical protein
MINQWIVEFSQDFEMLPSGKLTKLWKITMLWVNQLFLWAMASIAMFVYQAGYST